MQQIVAVVHARGGSVRVPLKNIRPLGGWPLIVWTVKAALASCCDRVIVSTDHDKIAEIARDAGADVPFRRPAGIAEDVASELVTQHAIRHHEEETGAQVDIAVTIQPTTPFLTAADIDGCIELLRGAPELDSAFTAGPVHQRPEWMFALEVSGEARKFMDGVIQGDAGVSQTLPALWHPNGGAYATRRRTLFEENLLIGRRSGIRPMTDLASVDIDNEVDFMIAEAVGRSLGYIG